MIGQTVLEDFRAQLARSLAMRKDVPPVAPLPITIWQAMGLLQKAIRRGRTDLALGAASTLYLASPERLWRRLGVIAFEDVGLGSLETVGLTTAALAGKRVRAGLGGEWPVASFLVQALSGCSRCRGADDLVMVVERHPMLREARGRQADLSIHQLRHIVLSTASLQERALALWLVLGTDRVPSDHLPSLRGEPAFAFDLLDELGAPMTIVEIAREGYRRTGQVLCPFVGLLASLDRPDAKASCDDAIPAEPMIGSLPCWTLDMFTREGRQALGRFLAGASLTATWVRAHVSQADRMTVLGHLVFYGEGGLTIARLRWPAGDELLRQAQAECYGPAVPDGAWLLDMLRADLPDLNRVRAAVMGSTHHAG